MPWASSPPPSPPRLAHGEHGHRESNLDGYHRNGKLYEESSHSPRRADAVRLLKLREGNIAKGAPVNPRMGRIIFEEAAQAVVNDYTMNGKRSVVLLKARIRKHLRPKLAGRRLTNITTADVRE
jgi:hypothetical protein